MSLTGTTQTPQQIEQQYKDSSNLRARAAIYHFAASKISWPTWVFDQMLAEIPQAASVVEIGCGPGGLWRTNLPRVPTQWRVVLSDLTPGMVEEATAAAADDGRFSVRQMDAMKMALPDASVDAVIANHMLYHVPDLPASLREIRRVLKPEGKLLATTNSERHMLRMKELIFEFLGDEASPLLSHLPFSLENGEAQLRRVFSLVQMRCLSGELNVTDSEVIVQYVLSVQSDTVKITPEKLHQLRQRAENEISSRGHIRFETAAGMFIAAK
jgi:ubiquinone/menaquinone biosynthesis C-methylase UbiE